MEEKRNDDENPIVIYTSQDGQVHVNVWFEGETAWLTQVAMAQLVGCTTENVIMHLENIYCEGELQDSATTKDFLKVRQEGTRQVMRQIKHYNLDAIIAVGYRVNSARATQFRLSERVFYQKVEERRASIEELERDISDLEDSDDLDGIINPDDREGR